MLLKDKIMKKSDLCATRQKMLVPVAEYPGAYALVPPPTPRFIPLPGIQNEVARAHEALGALQALTAKLPNPNLVTRTFDRREAVRSSQIEGTNSGVNDLLLYEATGSDEGLPPDVLVTLNYVKALEHGLKEVRNTGGVNALTCSLIKGLHAHLMAGVKDFKGRPGEFREKQNWIGGFKIYQARFVPPPPENVPACMTDLESLLRYALGEEDQFEAPIVIRMAIAHAQFETIHPFIDGNGRVGRILLPLMLAAEGYPPVYLAGFLKDNQQTYYDTLANVQLKEKWADWVRFFAAGVEVAAQESMRTAQELDAIHERWHRDVAGMRLRSDSAVNRLPELLIGNPVLTVRQVKDALGISFPAASGALALLEEKGILVQPVKQQRNRTFVAKEVIDLLARPSS
jgi:Fic family protein